MKTIIIIIITSLLISTQCHASVRGDILKGINSDHVSKFFNSIWNDAEAVSKEFDLPQGLLMAMAALESGYGRSRLAKENNNYLGIKYNGVYAEFSSRLECFKAWAKVLNQTCYKELEFKTLNGWLYQLEHCHYHLSKTYSNKIRWIYYKYDLDKLETWKKN